jgi:RNA polymerase sigma-70 factor (ECF subfamily)
MTDRAAVQAAVEEAHRRGWGLVLAATIRVTRDIDLAEECVQEAYAGALDSWGRNGIPDVPEAWLTTVARRRAMDAIRREHVLRSKLPLLIEPEEVDDIRADDGPDPFVTDEGAAVLDERLRLIFLCCHPALAHDAQLALTLRLVCGLSTADIARAFLVPEATMAARMTRAKKKIAATRIPYRVPAEAELPERLRGVLGVVHLLFTAGHTAPSGSALMRPDLVDRAIALARMLRELMPDEREVRGLLALLLVTDARRATRADADGRLLRLEDQDRSRWDRAAVAEARDLIDDGFRSGTPGRYLLQAAIAAVYAEAPSTEATDWTRILALYDALLTAWPSPVVALNRTVALAMLAGPSAALAEVDELERGGQLARYPYLPAVKADLLARCGCSAEALEAYRLALELTANDAERAFLTSRIDRLTAEAG